MDKPPLSEALLTRCLEGDTESWNVLTRFIHTLAIHRYKNQLGWPEQDIEDLVQDVCEVLVRDDYRVLRAYDPSRASLTTYLAAIIANVARHRRDLRPRFESQLDDEFPVNTGKDFEGVQVDRITLWEMALRILSALDVFVLRLYVIGYQFAEIASIVEQVFGKRVTPESLRKRKERALKKLRRTLYK